MTPTPTPTRTVLVGGACVLWCALVLTGLSALSAYGARPAPDTDALERLPETDQTVQVSTPRIVVAIHPHCPCTRATIAELARAAAIIRTRATIDAYVFTPDLTGSTEPTNTAWLGTDLVHAARAIPGVRVHADPAGRSAVALGLCTSGQVSVYDTDRRLRFTGGITPARGHEGDSAGRSALIDAALGRAHDAGVTRTPVYGCALAAERPASTPPAPHTTAEPVTP